MSNADAAPILNIDAGAVQLTRQLVDIFSVSGGERVLAEAIEAALSEAPHLRLSRDGDTIVARTELGRARRVVIAGHLDTVPVHNNLPSQERRDEKTGERVIWGRGSVDMKAGVAVQLVLALELTNPEVDLTWIWYDHEEVDASLNGLGRVQRNTPELIAGDFAILGEPTNAAIEGGCNGTLRALVRLRGKRAHSARAWMGRNAIHRAGAILQRLEAFTPETVCVDGLNYREGLNAVGVAGGVSGNTIPDLCEIEVNYRFAPSRSRDEAITIVQEFFFDADEVEIVDLAMGARPGLGDPLVQSLVTATRREARAKEGWTDVARFAELGIPAVNYGPGDPLLAHADDERVRVSEIQDVEAGLRAWIEGLETL